MYKLKKAGYNLHEKEKNMQGYWEEREVKELFGQVENYKRSNQSIKKAFAAHAQRYARKENSVRNYYYFELKDKDRLTRLGIDITKHEKTYVVNFSKEEEKDLIEKIENMTKGGMSVRKACLLLADGDALKLLRYQNKYRNHLSKTKKEKTVVADNIIAFKKPSGGLSESEVQSLFMGLVRLVKRNACIEGEERAKEKIESANQKLKRVLLQLQMQTREIDKMKERYHQLKVQNESLAGRLLASRCDNASKLSQKARKKTTSDRSKKEKISKRD